MRPTQSAQPSSHRVTAMPDAKSAARSGLPVHLFRRRPSEIPVPVDDRARSAIKAERQYIPRRSVKTHSSTKAIALTASSIAAILPKSNSAAAIEMMPVAMTQAKLLARKIGDETSCRRGTRSVGGRDRLSSPVRLVRMDCGWRWLSVRAGWRSIGRALSASSAQFSLNLDHKVRLKTPPANKLLVAYERAAVERTRSEHPPETELHRSVMGLRRPSGGNGDDDHAPSQWFDTGEPCARTQARQRPVQRISRRDHPGARIRWLYRGLRPGTDRLAAGACQSARCI